MDKCLRLILFILTIIFVEIEIDAAGEIELSQITNLPTIYIYTQEGVDIKSKEEYVMSMFYYSDGSGVTRFDSVGIRGRGNSTWNMPKKPYRIKFSKKDNLILGGAKAKSWTLLANCGDKLMIRNALASELGKFLGMEFNPGAVFVDLVINDNYQGTYQISDHVDVRKGRIDITEDGYFLEIGNKIAIERDEGDKPWFVTTMKDIGILVKYPEKEFVTSSQIEYIKTYINNFEEMLFSPDYIVGEVPYHNYVDLPSLLNWYIATEISGNVDGTYSTYVYKREYDDHLYWGPLWDFDIAWNNCFRAGDISEKLMANNGFGATATRIWVQRMWEDPWFAQNVNQRWKRLIDEGLRDYLLNKVDSLVEIITESRKLNYEKWDINYRYYDELYLHNTYEEYISDLKTYIERRIEYLTTEFEKRAYTNTTAIYSYDDRKKNVEPVFYNLHGRNVHSPLRKGVYIRKDNNVSKKIIVK